MSKLARDHRNSDLIKIQIARKQLNLTEEDYRTILQRQGGATSSKDLDHPGRQKVLRYFESLGWKPKASPTTKRPARPTPAADKLKLIRRIRAQLISLGNLPDVYADGIAERMYGLQFYEWADHSQLNAITVALSVEQAKKGAATK